MSNQPPYGYPPPGGDYPPPGGFQGGGYPPPGPPQGKTQFLGLDYNLAALLCYVPGCCCLIDLIASVAWIATEPKENRFLRFHALQGLLLFGVGVLLAIVFQVLGLGLAISPSDLASAGGSIFLLMIELIVFLALLVIHILGMVKAYQGHMWKIPVIGEIADKNA